MRHGSEREAPGYAKIRQHTGIGTGTGAQRWWRDKDDAITLTNQNNHDKIIVM